MNFVNDTEGPHSLIPMLLVFGVFLRALILTVEFPGKGREWG